MSNHKHIEIRKQISDLDVLPNDDSEYMDWIHATRHLGLLQYNEMDDELIIYALCNHIFIHGVVVEESSLKNLNYNSLLHWSGNPYEPCAAYGWSRKVGYGIQRDNLTWEHESLNNAQQLIFGREHLGSKDGHYYEILQEYAHLADIHWRSERDAYCRFDELGDWEHVVSITREDSSDLDLVTFKRQQLDQFLKASNSILVRTFEFRLHPLDGSVKWTADIETVNEDATLFYQRRIEASKAGYYRGVQIIYPSPSIRLPSQAISGQTTHKESEYVEFTAWDLRYKRIADISTSPSATTNRIVPENDLPYGTSPAFFRAEVLSKYKNDPDKYTIDEGCRLISCRGGWSLQSYGMNDAGQVYAYICDLQKLPYKEQLYWKSFNDEPKAGISQRSIETDFHARFFTNTTPLEDLLAIMRRWSETNVCWWHLREKGLEMDIHPPNNRQEWALSFLSIAKLVIEGLRSDFFYGILVKAGKANKKDKGLSIRLATLVLTHRGVLGSGTKLEGLEEIQLIRSKCIAHPRGSDAHMLENEAIEKFGSYSAHFNSVCRKVIVDLERMEQAFQ